MDTSFPPSNSHSSLPLAVKSYVSLLTCNESFYATPDRTLSLNSHGFLESLKAPLQLVEYRSKFYQFTIAAILESVGVSTEKLQFVLGSSFQKSPEYIMDVYKLTYLVSEHEAKGQERRLSSSQIMPL